MVLHPPAPFPFLPAFRHVALALRARWVSTASADKKILLPTVTQDAYQEKLRSINSHAARRRLILASFGSTKGGSISFVQNLC
jgi:hypothetical protein